MFRDEKTARIGATIVWTLLYAMVAGAQALGYEDGFETILAISIVPGLYILGRFVLTPLFHGKKAENKAGFMSMNGAMIMAGILLMASLVTGYLGDANLLPGDVDTNKRHVSGVFMGLVFILMGNYMPKIVEPITKAACDPATHQRFQRQSGWIFVITGFVYTGAWFVFERETANTVSTTAVVICILLVAPRLVWYGMKLRQHRQSRPTNH
jgi:hypothetical protein